MPNENVFGVSCGASANNFYLVDSTKIQMREKIYNLLKVTPPILELNLL